MWEKIVLLTIFVIIINWCLLIHILTIRVGHWLHIIYTKTKL